jgi:hypothetical protein
MGGLMRRASHRGSENRRNSRHIPAAFDKASIEGRKRQRHAVVAGAVRDSQNA